MISCFFRKKVKNNQAKWARRIVSSQQACKGSRIIQVGKDFFAKLDPPPSPLKILWKKSLPKRGNFVFFTFFSTVMIVYHTGFSPLSLNFCICCPCPRLKFHHCEKTRKYLASFFSKSGFSRLLAKIFRRPPLPPSDFTLWQRYLCQLELWDFTCIFVFFSQWWSFNRGQGQQMQKLSDKGLKPVW